jgi:signal transduction histidine kinase
MEDIGPEAKQQAIRDANIELYRADQLVRNVRRLGMAAELLPEKLISIDIFPIIHESFMLASRKAKMQEINFTVNPAEGECFVRGNVLIKDVFLNIFDNSIKYSDDTPQIDVVIDEVVYEMENWCSIKISDHGIGIDPNRRSRLFERYMEDAVGSGLGLSVVRTLVQAYGGRIMIDERVPGDYTKGTTFTVLLRKA